MKAWPKVAAVVLGVLIPLSLFAVGANPVWVVNPIRISDAGINVTFPTIQSVQMADGGVAVSNWPSTSRVYVLDGGMVNVTNWPSSSQVYILDAGPVNVANFPSSQRLAGSADELAEVDEFGRLKVGIPYTLADLQMKYEINTRDWYQQTGDAGTVTHNADKAAAELYVPDAKGAIARITTNTYWRYQAGKEQSIKQTVVASTADQQYVTAMWGYYDDYDGLYWKTVQGVLSACLRSSVTGSVVDTCTTSAEFNIDAFPDLGSFSPEESKGNIYEIRFQWLGVGRVLFSINGHPVHKLDNAGANTTVYMKTATLPVRAEIYNHKPLDILPTSPATLYYICTSIESSGGQEDPEEPFSAFNSSPVTVSSSEIGLMAIKLKYRYPDGGTQTNRMSVVPFHVNVACIDSTKPAWFFVYLVGGNHNNGSVDGGTWLSTSARSGVEYIESPTYVSGGDPIHSGISSTTADLSLNHHFKTRGRTLRLDADGDLSDILVVTAKRATNQDASCRVTISWGEVR